ncbi:hypothetical protein CANCADRAFT_25391 [Tortispora caseinolytica NRRL Y-17796]|uniref:Transcriptional repressor Tup1 N-terminal domain-containing protein n=1 Tax=Tortispora caseinolytica NRRL Y-17796 TaxID=767744 RepID=A0A1E4TF11_9ASCO|nr:hypothetical protein CANCADRAFT_25391 [Tortispora caseinolytica NRRL Y-17796]
MIHPSAHGQRVNELLDAIKHEFDSITSEASVYRMHKDELDHKSSQQVHEMQQIRQTIYDLETAHRKMQERYDEEVARLKRELENALASNGSAGQGQAQRQQPVPMPHPPVLSHFNTVFGGIMGNQSNGSNQPPTHASQTQQPQQQQQLQQRLPPQPQQSQQQLPQSQSQHTLPPQQPPQQTIPGSVDQSMPQAPGSSTGPDGPPRVESGYYNAYPPGNKPAVADVTGTNNAMAPASARPSGRPEEKTEIAHDGNASDADKLYKKHEGDWYVLYNPQAPRVLDVNLVHTLEHSSVVCCVRFSADGKFVATGCNFSAQIFDVQTGQRICVLLADKGNREGDLYIRSVCFSPDGRYLATGAEDCQIRVWDIKAKTIQHVFKGHEQDIYSLDFARDGRRIASGSGDRTVRLWDLDSQNCLLTLTIEDGVTTVAISPDGRFIAAGSLDNSVRIWDANTGLLVERLEAPGGHLNSVYSVAFAPNGKDLVSASLDKTIKYWELQSARGLSTHQGGVCTRTFTGHNDFVLSVALTPDGHWVFSGSKDRCVQFWDPVTGQNQLILQGHKNSVISVAPSPAGHLFATGSGDCRARIWQYTYVDGRR